MRAFEHNLSACVGRLGRPISESAIVRSSAVDFGPGRKKEREETKIGPTMSLSESTVYHVVTTDDAMAGISSTALGKALRGHRLGERYGEFLVRAHRSTILKNRRMEVRSRQEKKGAFGKWRIWGWGSKQHVAGFHPALMLPRDLL